MKRWQRVALMLLPLVAAVFAGLWVVQLDKTRDAKAENVASAAQVEALADQIAGLEAALQEANAKVDALALQVASLGGEPVVTSGTTGGTTPTTTPPTTTPTTNAPCIALPVVGCV